MSKWIKDLMLPLSEYAVVGEDATILDALNALEDAQDRVPPGRQPHRAVLVRNRRGAIVGKLHYFAFLRAFIPEPRPASDRNMLERSGLTEELLQESLRTLDLFAGDLVDVCERARTIAVRDVYTRATHRIDVDATLADAVSAFLTYQTLSLLVQRAGITVGILRLSDLFDELGRQIRHNACE